MLVRGQDAVGICEKHRKHAVPIYNHCVGCEIEGLRESEAALRARVARLEAALGEISTLYWVDAPAPEEMRRIARRALEEK